MASTLRAKVSMSIHLIALIFAAAATSAVPQSGASTRQAQPGTSSDQTLTLTGCVQADEIKANSFKFADKKSGTTYRLSGTSVKAFVWKNVRIMGGLVPSPNIAAQAGAVDPATAAMASHDPNPLTTTGTQPLEFKVTGVRGLSGSCSPTSK